MKFYDQWVVEFNINSTDGYPWHIQELASAVNTNRHRLTEAVPRGAWIIVGVTESQEEAAKLAARLKQARKEELQKIGLTENWMTEWQ